SSVIGDAQTSAYVRRQLSGAGYQWWTGTAWTTAQAAATGGNEATVVIGAGVGDMATATSTTVLTTTWTAADVYSYSVETAGATLLISGYAPAVSFTVANTAPTTPTLTALYGAGGNVTMLTFTSGDTNTTGSIEF